MLKISALALLGAMTFTTAAQMHGDRIAPPPITLPAATDDPSGDESLAIYYSPLNSTEVARYFGLAKAFPMAIVYTDAAGISHGASSGPSDLAASQTPGDAFTAVLASFSEAPSAFGTLKSDPRNDTPFVLGSAADVYSKDSQGRAYPHAVVLRGRDLAARWHSILGTYARTDRMQLTYSPVSQNSNSLAAVALRRAGVTVPFSSDTVLAPGAYTDLP